MKLYRYAAMTADERARVFQRAVADIFSPALIASVQHLIADVQQRGDAALVDALRIHDHVEVSPAGLLVSEAEFDAAHEQVSPDVLAGIDLAIANVRAYNERLRAHSGTDWLEPLWPGCWAGEQTRPIASAGLYVPCGKGSFPSVMIHIATPAIVAGVPDLTVVVPPVPGQGGAVDAATLVVARRLGIARVVRSNGVAGIAALAVGTPTVPRVGRITGPGSPAVTAAQIAVQAFGVQVSMLFGPSETAVLADASADPHRVALDILTEAEHGSDSTALLVTPSQQLAEAVQEAAARILATLPAQRRTYAQDATTRSGGIILTDSLDEAIAVVNLFAPEHLQIATQDPLMVATRIDHAAEILIGQDTPNVAANYALGTPNTLPTSGFARACSGVTVHTYLKYSSLAYLSAAGLAALAPGVLALARHEGFPAHMAALEQRGLDR